MGAAKFYTNYKLFLMRIIGQIPHPYLKISVFKNDNRLSVKFENAGYEITCKLGDDERIRTVSDVEQLLDAVFLENILQTLGTIHTARLGLFARQFPPANTEIFPEII
jgi:hypothetical protein